MVESQTWQQLPSLLLTPLLAGVISQAEASQLWDLMLRSPPWEDVVPLPPNLQQAGERLALWAMPVEAPLQ